MKNGGPPLEDHFIFEIYVGKIRIRYKTTLKLNDENLDRLKIDDVIQFQSRSMSDPPLADIDCKNKMALVWATLKKVFWYIPRPDCDECS